jgi:hypothetical protein
LPDEISAAADTLRRSVADAVTGPGMHVRYFLFYLSLLAVGCWIGLGLYQAGLADSSSMNLWQALLTVLSVLSGFMITAMLFTGAADIGKSLSFEQLKTFCQKSNHLLISQLCTLASNFIGLLLIGLILAIGPKNWPYTESLVVFAFGFIFISVFRSLLVPVQIIELHRFAHAAVLEEKRVEEENKATEI